ncbi:hypothetical protein BGX34_010353 [Mortierella sp. NVP85]|nr:hypothetical protein BGX34_010353 [Mortierella sp. NVP85]
MRREEEEHRQRECGLYEKIIELQIENANLKGDKDSLTRIVSRRDKMLVELQMQLQALEFVCRENNFKVDIDLRSDEVIENWSFKESDECYQRILLSTQDLLRAGEKCLETPMTGRASSQHARSVRSPTGKRSLEHGRASPASLSDSVRSGRGASPLMFKDSSRAGSFNNSSRSLVSQSSLSEIDAGIVRDRRAALDCGDDRSGIDNQAEGQHSDDDSDSQSDDSEESEFEELGEDMIKYVELQSSVGPRRDSSRSSSGSKPAGTPDMPASVLMKNVYGRTGGAHPFYQQQRRSRANRSSGGSLLSNLSNSSLLDDYYTRSRRSTESSRSNPSPQPGAHIGLGLIGINRSPEQVSMERFLAAPPMGALPPSPVPSSATSTHFFMTNYNCSSHVRSPPSSNSSAVFLPSYGMDYNSTDCPPPMVPLPPLPDTPRYSYRDHMKQKLLEFKRPTHGRTYSHGFAIENVGQFTKRKNFGKTLVRDWIQRGHRRRDSL